MDPEPDIHDLARQVAVMEQSMETMQANLTATLEGFRTDQARLRETMAHWKTDMAHWKTDMAKRDAEAANAAARRDTDMAKRDAEAANAAARRDTDMARRETRLVFYMVAIVTLGFTIFGFVTA